MCAPWVTRKPNRESDTPDLCPILRQCLPGYSAIQYSGRVSLASLRYSKHTVKGMLALARPQNATQRSEEGHPLQTPSTQHKHVLIEMCINTYERCTLSPWTHESELSPVPKKQSSRRRIRQLGNAAMMRWRPEPSYNYSIRYGHVLGLV